MGKEVDNEFFDIFPPSIIKCKCGCNDESSSSSSSTSTSSSGWNNYNKMFATAVKFKDIQTRIMYDLGLTMYDSLPELLGNDVSSGMKILKDIILRTIRIYSQYFPEKMIIYLKNPGSKYTFVDNFQQYLDGKISEEEVILVPVATPFNISSGVFLNSRNWMYKKPTMYGTAYAGAIPSGQYGYYAAMPYKVEIGEDGDFTEDSVLYSTDDQRSHEVFMVLLDLEVAHRLKRLVTSLNIGGNIDVLPMLDYALQDLEQRKASYIRQATSHLSYMWRK